MVRFAVVVALAGVLSASVMAPVVGAQQSSGITGIVKDTSGAILPGVTVEAASSSLIEKSRSAVTDEQGRFNIVDLVPGTYTVTFTLTGFNAIKREGIILTSGFTALVNVDLQVGSLEETITVSGASPLVDTSNARRQVIASAELLSTLPVSTKNIQSLVTLTPGWSGIGDVGGRYLVEPGAFHGKRGTKVSFDGLVVENSDGNSSYQINAAAVSEMAAQTSGLSAEVNADGPVMNMIPKEGGNSFNTIAAGLFSNSSLEGSNLNDELRSRGFTSVNQTDRLYDASVSIGGPIKKNELWFFTAPRTWGVSKAIAGDFWNKTQDVFLTPAGAARKVVQWTPWVDRPLDALSGRYEWYNSAFGRGTWQASARNKFNLLFDYQRACNCYGSTTGLAQEAAGASYKFQPSRLIQATWSSPRTSRLLMEAGTAFNISQWNAFWEPGADTPSIISVRDVGLGITLRVAADVSRQPELHQPLQPAILDHVRDRHAYPQGWCAERRARHQRAVHHQRQRELHVQERRPDQPDAVLHAVPATRSRQRLRHVCPGKVDDQPAHAGSGCALRLLLRLGACAVDAGRPVLVAGLPGSQRVARRAELRSHQGRALLEGSQPAAGRLIRPVWATARLR